MPQRIARRAGVGTLVMLLGLGLVPGCRPDTTSADSDLVTDVFQAYLSPANAAPLHARPESAGRVRYERLTVALEGIIAKHPAAPATTLARVKELHACCRTLAEKCAAASAKIRPGALPPEWDEINRLAAEFETDIRTLPGAEAALGKLD